jgi:hypothetical protein
VSEKLEDLVKIIEKISNDMILLNYKVNELPIEEQKQLSEMLQNNPRRSIIMNELESSLPSLNNPANRPPNFTSSSSSGPGLGIPGITMRDKNINELLSNGTFQDSFDKGMRKILEKYSMSEDQLRTECKKNPDKGMLFVFSQVLPQMMKDVSNDPKLLDKFIKAIMRSTPPLDGPIPSNKMTTNDEDLEKFK